MRPLLPIFFIALLPTLAHTTHARMWKDSSGKHSIEAEFLAVAEDDTVLLRTADKKVVGVPLSSLSTADQKIAQNEMAKLANSIARGDSESEPSVPSDVASQPVANPGEPVPQIEIKIGKGIPAKAETAIRQAVNDYFGAEVSTVPKSKLLVADVYSAKLTMGTPEDGQSSTDMQFLLLDDDVKHMPQLSTDKELPELLAVIDPEFRIKTEADAKEFEKLLDTLYPIGDFDAEHKAMREVDGKWQFIRGDFFDDLKGVIVTTNGEGKITSIQNKLKIPK